MSIDATPGWPAAGQSPRNPWTRLRHVLTLLAAGHVKQAAWHLEAVRYHAGLPREAFDIYAGEVRAALGACDLHGQIDRPCAYTAAVQTGLRPPFRQLQAGARPAAPYPAGMVLPHFAGPQNDTGFLRDAAGALAAQGGARGAKVDVLLAADATTDVAALGAALAAQEGDMQIRLTVMGNAVPAGISLPAAVSPRILRDHMLSPQAGGAMGDILTQSDSDITVFLSGNVVLDAGFLQRAWHLARASEAVVQALVPVPRGQGGLQPLTGWHLEHEIATSHLPYRDVGGMNLVVRTALLRRVGLPDTGFRGLCSAAREICWRLFHKGAYFAPLAVPVVAPARDPVADAADAERFMALCPDPLGHRKQEGGFERPRVDIYIPAYNASSYICRAVDSVLGQDMKDLQVCVADDGSTDETWAVLQKQYGDEPRVRLETGPNGGIGHASNRAIAMGRAPYVGQLDSDDCLKPGAVRKLMTWLDAHPETACVYGSCERIDAQGGHIKNEFNWPVFSREKMMVTSIAHHFRMFRRAAWERTTRFREDIANAVDYDLLLKLSETGTFHHFDEILYQRRWHGENTSDVNEDTQTANTHIAQNEALGRLGLGRFWQLHIPDPKLPRQVSYQRRAGVKTLVFWPDRSQKDPAQHLLYATMAGTVDICSGPIDAAVEQLATFDAAADLTFHLHDVSAVLEGATEEASARAAAEAFAGKAAQFVAAGGQFIWTVDGAGARDKRFADVEAALSGQLAKLAHRLHFYSRAAVDLAARVFDVPHAKICISKRGNYIGSYPDFVSGKQARSQLGLAMTDDVILVLPPVQNGVGASQAQVVLKGILKARASAAVLWVGQGDVAKGLSPSQQARVHVVDRPLDDLELQVFMRAADVAVCPRDPAAVLLALGFGLPVAAPSDNLVRDILDGSEAGVLYSASGAQGVPKAVKELFGYKDAGRLAAISTAAYKTAQAHPWPDFTPIACPPEGPT